MSAVVLHKLLFGDNFSGTRVLRAHYGVVSVETCTFNINSDNYCTALVMYALCLYVPKK
jgi:hypothetical protein